jgi:recombination protein RecA
MAIKEKKKTEKQVEEISSDKGLLDEFAKETNAKGKVAYSPEDDRQFFEVRRWVSTGSIALDYKMSGKREGGIPYGFITELAGESQSGKSLIAWHIVKNAQIQDNAICVYYDVESRVNNAFMDLIGIDRSRTLINEGLKSAEDIFNNIMAFLKKLSLSKNPNRYVVIVIDSIAQMTSIEELDKDFGEKTMASRARLLHELYRKVNVSLRNYNVALVALNQVRQNMNKRNKYDDEYYIPSGTATEHNASIRARLFCSSVFKDSDGDVIGNRIRAKITKNSFIPANRVASFPLYYADGIANEESIEEILIEGGIIKGTTWKSLTTTSGKEYKWQGTSKFRQLYLDNSELREYCLDELDKLLKYSPENWYNIEKLEEKLMIRETEQEKEISKLDALLED